MLELAFHGWQQIGLKKSQTCETVLVCEWSKMWSLTVSLCCFWQLVVSLLNCLTMFVLKLVKTSEPFAQVCQCHILVTQYWLSLFYHGHCYNLQLLFIQFT